MKTLYKNFIRQSLNQGVAEDVLALLDILIVFSKKFGRELSHSSVQSFLVKSYPDVARLYELLGSSHLNYKILHFLRNKLYLALGTHHITVNVSHAVAIPNISDDNILIGSGGVNPSLIVSSGDKIYRRSLYDDLGKIFA